MDLQDYARDHARAAADARHLEREHLIDRVSWDDRDGARRDTLTLTREGRTLLERNDPDRAYTRAKEREREHDARVYAMYREHEKRLAERRDAHVERVRADHELKRRLWQGEHDRPMAVDRAQTLGLPVDDQGRIHIPDLQLEVREADGSLSRCNLEYVTEHYSGAAIRAKLAAGFVLYGDAPAHGGERHRGRSLVAL